MKNIVIFGEQPIASAILDIIMQNDSFCILGAVCMGNDRDYSHHCLPYPRLKNFCLEHRIRILEQSEIPGISSNTKIMGLTVRWGHLLPKTIIDCFSEGIINFHGGYLPRWRGVNIPTHLILEGASEGGATIHYIDEKVDTGPILARGTFPISEKDTALDIYIKTQSKILELFRTIVPKLSDGLCEAVQQDDLLDHGEIAKTYYNKGFSDLRCVKLTDNPELIEKSARAFEFPGYERAFFLLGKRKIYITPEITKNHT